MIHKCVNNFISAEDNFNISNALMTTTFPWFRLSSLIENSVFYHELIKDKKIVSPFVDVISPLTKKISKDVYGASCFYIPHQSNDKEVLKSDPGDKPGITKVIYYPFSSDGITKFKIGKTFETVSNTAIFFDSLLQTAETGPTKDNYRLIIELFFK